MNSFFNSICLLCIDLCWNFPWFKVFFGNVHTVDENISKHVFFKCSCHGLNFFWKEITFSLIVKVSLRPWKDKLCVYFFKKYLLDDILTVATCHDRKCQLACNACLFVDERIHTSLSGFTCHLNALSWVCGTRDLPGCSHHMAKG